MRSSSRDSSPLSDVSSDSSPGPNSPRPLRSPSLDLSSSDRSRAHSDDEDELAGLSDFDDAPSGSGARRKSSAGGGASLSGRATGGPDKYGFDPKALPTAQCQWGDCDAEFYELEPFIEHLHNIHAFPPHPDETGPKKVAVIYSCDWVGCPRRGKNQTSKFALVGHLRSHTGEKPFNCPRAECDKSFTRTDALQKHMRIQHAETIVAARRPLSKKRKTGARATSFDSLDNEDEALVGAGGAGGEEAESANDVAWTEEDVELFHKHPDLGKGFVAYVVAKAKWTYLIGEHEGMLGELEALGTREAELGAECEELLRRVMRKEVGQDKQDPTNAAQLETFLTNYSHTPLPLPPDWSTKP